MLRTRKFAARPLFASGSRYAGGTKAGTQPASVQPDWVARNCRCLPCGFGTAHASTAATIAKAWGSETPAAVVWLFCHHSAARFFRSLERSRQARCPRRASTDDKSADNRLPSSLRHPGRWVAQIRVPQPEASKESCDGCKSVLSIAAVNCASAGPHYCPEAGGGARSGKGIALWESGARGDRPVGVRKRQQGQTGVRDRRIWPASWGLLTAWSRAKPKRVGRTNAVSQLAERLLCPGSGGRERRLRPDNVASA